MKTTRLLHSSSFRLALVYMALFSTSVLILLGFIYWSTAGYMVRQTEETIDAEITGLAERYDISGLAGLTALISERLARNPSGETVYLLTDPALNRLLGNLNRWPKVPESQDGWVTFRLGDTLEQTGKGRQARARTFRLRGGFHLLVGRDIQELEKIQHLIITTLGWGLAITGVLALVGGSMMSRSIVTRIEAINETCREIMFGDLSRRIPGKSSGDDFDQLIGNLNNMLDQIENLMNGVRQVSDNIAHDLRTPLTRLHRRLAQLKETGGEEGPQREHLDMAIAEADGLLSTFKALLRISRIESGSRRAGFEEIDLAALLQDVAELYEPLAEEKGLRFTLKPAEATPVQGDRDLLFQALANLVDNAIKYTPAGGGIFLALCSAGGAPQVTISDTGPGIPAEDREKVFQRFFRLEKSRTTSGNGLGLSLVAAVATLHQATIALDDNEPGLRVTMGFGQTA